MMAVFPFHLELLTFEFEQHCNDCAIRRRLLVVCSRRRRSGGVGRFGSCLAELFKPVSFQRRALATATATTVAAAGAFSCRDERRSSRAGGRRAHQTLPHQSGALHGVRRCGRGGGGRRADGRRCWRRDADGLVEQQRRLAATGRLLHHEQTHVPLTRAARPPLQRCVESAFALDACLLASRLSTFCLCPRLLGSVFRLESNRFVFVAVAFPRLLCFAALRVYLSRPLAPLLLTSFLLVNCALLATQVRCVFAVIHRILSSQRSERCRGPRGRRGRPLCNPHPSQLSTEIKLLPGDAVPFLCWQLFRFRVRERDAICTRTYASRRRIGNNLWAACRLSRDVSARRQSLSGQTCFEGAQRWAQRRGARASAPLRAVDKYAYS